MTAPRTLRYTADYLWETPDDGNRYEVIDGELFVTPPPGWAHQYAASRLHRIVANHVIEGNLGECLVAPLGVVLDAEGGVQPDLVSIARERLGIASEQGVEGAPDMVVEVLSPSTQGRHCSIKMRRYARAGIRYYWILAPSTRTLEERRQAGDGYELIGSFGPEDVFRPELFPGLAITIAELWD